MCVCVFVLIVEKPILNTATAPSQSGTHIHTPVVGLYGDLWVTINQAQALIWDRSGFLLLRETCS